MMLPSSKPSVKQGKIEVYVVLPGDNIMTVADVIGGPWVFRPKDSTSPRKKIGQSENCAWHVFSSRFLYMYFEGHFHMFRTNPHGSFKVNMNRYK